MSEPFHIGQRVRVAVMPPGDPDNARLLGQQGSITEIGAYHVVRLDSGVTGFFEAKELERVTISRTYCEIQDDEKCLATLPREQRIAWSLLRFLYDRKGFDDWWDRISDEVKDELFEDLSAEMKKHLAS